MFVFSDSKEFKKIFSNVLKTTNSLLKHQDPTGVYAFPIAFVLKHYQNLQHNVFFSKPYLYILQKIQVQTNSLLVIR